MMQLFLQTTTMQFTISSDQDACLEHAEGLGALPKVLKSFFPPFPIFKNIQITT
jgi:hypothetical protein